MILEPRIGDYSSYRDFLRDFYSHRKSRKTGFSYRLFARRAGMRSPNYLQLVMQGKRNLSPEAARKVAVAMGLKGAESDYFVGLAQRDSARREEDRQDAEKSLRMAKGRIVSRLIPKAQAEVLSRWHHLVVRELAMIDGFRPEGAWISRRLHGLITAEQAEESLSLLVRGGFLVNPRPGVYRVQDPVIDTGDDALGELVVRTHVDTLQAWRELLPRIPAAERELGLLNIPIRSENVPELKRRIRAFQDEIIGWLESEKAPDQVVQLGTYLVPITTGR